MKYPGSPFYIDQLLENIDPGFKPPSFAGHISNYSGNFEQGASYKKFDFVYNTGDSSFYYAKEDITDGAGLVLESSHRFSLDPDGPLIDGKPSYYIIDELAEAEALGSELQVGQTLKIEGSVNGNDGSFLIKDVEANVENIPDSDIILQTLDVSTVGFGWYRSSWFLFPGRGGDNELNLTSFWRSQETNWIRTSALGWLYLSPLPQGLSLSPPERKLWFFRETFFSRNTPEGALPAGHWIYASEELIGGSDLESNSFLYLVPQFTNELGPEGWLYLSKGDQDNSMFIYNFSNEKWYGIKRDLAGVNNNVNGVTITQSKPSFPVPDRLGDGRVSKIQIQGLTDNDSIVSFEEKSSNPIKLSLINFTPGSSPDKWAKDLFFFDCDYGSSANFKCDNFKYEFGNGYYITQPKSINSLSCNFNLSFKNRTNREANAIIHFLENHQGQHEKHENSVNLKYSQGVSGFRWGGDSTFHPYDSISNQSKDFYCNEFSHSLNFENSNDISLSFRNFNTSILNKSESMYVKPPGSYNENINYQLNDVIFSTGDHEYYYYWNESSSVNGRSPVRETSEYSREFGYYEQINKEFWTRDFFWKPSLGLEVNHSVSLQEISVDNSYIQMYKDGINDNLLTLNLSFNNRGDEEAWAILHFLESHYGSIPFLFSPPAPYETPQNFICSEWSHVYNFKNNHSISAVFEQFPFNLTSSNLSSYTSPPLYTPGELSFSSPLVFSDKFSSGGYNKQRIRNRLKLENIGDGPVTLHSIICNDDHFEILGSNSLVPPFIPESTSAESFIYVLPSDKNLPFNLDGAKIKLDKKFKDGLDGGQFFILMEGSGTVKSEWTPKLVNGRQQSFFQDNTGRIRDVLDEDGERYLCEYFIAEQFFENNSQAEIPGGSSGFIDIVFDGEGFSQEKNYLVNEDGEQIYYKLVGDDIYESYVNKYSDLSASYLSFLSQKLSFSREFKLKIHTRDTLSTLFQKMLDRVPNDVETNDHWGWSFDGNTTVGQAIEIIEGSPEFKDKTSKSLFGKIHWNDHGPSQSRTLPESSGPIEISNEDTYYSSKIIIESSEQFSPQEASLSVYIKNL